MIRQGFVSLVLAATLAAPAFAAPGSYVRATQPEGFVAQPNATTGKLTYHGGPMIQHVKVFLVFYSPGHQYKDQLVKFYTAITQSAYIDMLQEYDQPNYKIRRGSYLGLFEDSNVNPTAVKKVDPVAYLKGLLTAKKVPDPTDDTLYMIYFPDKIDPTDPQGKNSCISMGDYCAYHYSFTQGKQHVYYGVMPDQTACGCGPAGFPGFSDVSSHEVIEALTDPEVITNYAWNDDNKGEIGDICAGTPEEIAVVDGWTVQTEWSNALNKCAAVNPKYSVNDFSMAAAPASVMVPQGGSVTTKITLTKMAGMADTVTLAASAPAGSGLVGSLSPGSASSDNGSSTLTITADATAMLGAAKITVTGNNTGATVSKTQDIDVTVVMGGGSGGNGGGSGGNGGGSGGNGGGSGGNGGGSGGNGGSSGGNGGSSGGNGGSSGGNGNNPGGGSHGCSLGGAGGSGGWAAAALLLLALAARRRRA